MSTQNLNQIKESNRYQPRLSNKVNQVNGDKYDKGKVKYVIISFTPTPYRDKVYDLVANELGVSFKVYYCGTKEPIRDWKLKKLNHEHVFLKGWSITQKEEWRFIYFNPEVWKYLLKDRPEVVITKGFNPTQLFGWLYCLIFRKAHIPFTDTWEHSDSILTIVHKVVRKLVFSTSKAFIGPGKRTSELYQMYGVDTSKFFQSHLAANTEIFSVYKPLHERPYDLMFAGQIQDRKSPLFFVEVANRLRRAFPALKILIIGNGPQKKEMIENLNEANIDYHYPGFIQPEELPDYYSASKIFLFPTKLDAWGVVANEALASGTPVIISPFAGAANDLVIDGENGYVLDLVLDQWVDKISHLLNRPELWKKMSLRGLETKQIFSYQNAAAGIIKACKYLKDKSRNIGL